MQEKLPQKRLMLCFDTENNNERMVMVRERFSPSFQVSPFSRFSEVSSKITPFETIEDDKFHYQSTTSFWSLAKG
jgi:hypothetical protein